MSQSKIALLSERLEQAKTFIEEQAQTIKQLSVNPLTYALIARTGNKAKFRRQPEVKDYSKGVKVLTEDGVDGTIVAVQRSEENDYEADVKIKNGKIEKYPLADLQLVEPTYDETPTVTLILNGGFIEVADAPALDLKVGNAVLLNKSGAIVSKTATIKHGGLHMVKEVIDDTFVEIVFNHETKVVLNGGLKLEKGQKVVVDSFGLMILKSYQKESTEYVRETVEYVNPEDIGGLEDAKRELLNVVELPYKHPDIIKHYGYKLPQGVLLEGPPGCGKTMLGKMIWTVLTKTHSERHGTKGNGSSGFYYVKGPEILNK
jgi:preprotein translocase subunit YajC